MSISSDTRAENETAPEAAARPAVEAGTEAPPMMQDHARATLGAAAMQRKLSRRLIQRKAAGGGGPIQRKIQGFPYEEVKEVPRDVIEQVKQAGKFASLDEDQLKIIQGMINQRQTFTIRQVVERLGGRIGDSSDSDSHDDFDPRSGLGDDHADPIEPWDPFGLGSTVPQLKPPPRSTNSRVRNNNNSNNTNSPKPDNLFASNSGAFFSTIQPSSAESGAGHLPNSYEAQVERLRKAPPKFVEKSLKPLFYGDQDLERRHTDPLWDVESESSEEEYSSKTPLISPQETKRQETLDKKREHVAKVKEKREKKQERREGKEKAKLDEKREREAHGKGSSHGEEHETLFTRREMKEMKHAEGVEKRKARETEKVEKQGFSILDEDRLSEKAEEKQLASERPWELKALGVVSSIKDGIAKPYKMIKEKKHEHDAQRYHSERSNARENWRELELIDLERMLLRWEKEYRVDRAILLEFLRREYPNLSLYCEEVLGLRFDTLGGNGPSSHVKMASTFNNAATTAKTTGAETGAVITSTKLTDQWSTADKPLEFKGDAGGVTGGINSGMSLGMDMKNAVDQLQAMEKLLVQLDGIDRQLATVEKDSEEEKQLLAQRVNLMKAIRIKGHDLEITGVGGASDVASLVLKLAHAPGSAAGVLSLVTFPIAAWKLKRDFHDLTKLKDSLQELQVAQSDLSPSSGVNAAIDLKLGRVKDKARDKKINAGTGAVSLGLGLAAGGIALAGLIVGSAFTAGAVLGVVAAAGGGVALGLLIKSQVQGRLRGIKHKDLHLSLQNELTADEPDLAQADKDAEGLLASDPQVAAHALYLAFLNSRGEGRSEILEVLKAVGVSEDKLAPYRGGRIADDQIKSPITEDDILKALKS